jgi:large subunit ribosomal protein L29
MRPDEIRELANADIERTIEEMADELFQLRMKSAYEEIDNPMRIRRLRRDIARLKTIKRERELQAARDAREK